MPLNLGEEFGLDAKSEVEGVWFNLGDGGAIKLARMGNPESARAYRKIPPAIRKQLDAGVMEEGQVEDFFVKFLADNIVKDWRGIADEGKIIEFSSANAVLMMKKHKRFRERIQELSGDDDFFNVEAEADAKNLPVRSVGS